MGNYRESMSKRSCLFNAVVWSIIIAVNLLLTVDKWRSGYLNDQKALLIVTAIALVVLAIHWYRFLCYDKKINTNQEEQNNE